MERMMEEQSRNTTKIALAPFEITILNNMTRSYSSVYARKKSINV